MEKFAREGKHMRNLDHYMVQPPERRRDAGAVRVKALFERMKKRQEQNGPR